MDVARVAYPGERARPDPAVVSDVAAGVAVEDPVVCFRLFGSSQRIPAIR